MSRRTRNRSQVGCEDFVDDVWNSRHPLGIMKPAMPWFILSINHFEQELKQNLGLGVMINAVPPDCEHQQWNRAEVAVGSQRSGVFEFNGEADFKSQLHQKANECKAKHEQVMAEIKEKLDKFKSECMASYREAMARQTSFGISPYLLIAAMIFAVIVIVCVLLQ